MSDQTALPSDAAEPQRRSSNLRRDLYRLCHSSSFVIGSLIVLFWLFCAIFGPMIVPHDPYADDLLMSLKPPSAEHWFGTDQLGRDIFSRVLVGSRDILTVAPIATMLSTILGTSLGLVMGYFGGWIDEVLNRLVDAVLALPTIIVALLALTALGTSIVTVVLVIAFTFSPVIARTVRSAVLAFNVIVSRDRDTALRLVRGKEEFRAAERRATALHFGRLRDGSPRSAESSSLHLDTIRDLKQINSLLAALAYPVLEEQGLLLTSRLRDASANSA